MNMSSIEIKLVLPGKILEKLNKEKETFAYSDIQEIIIETLRKKYFKTGSPNESKKGRPKKVDESAVLSREKIFDKDGVALDL